MITPTKLEQHIQESASFTFSNYVRPTEVLSPNDTPTTLKSVAMPAKYARIIANWITMMAVHRSGGYHHIIGALSAYDMAAIFAVAYCYNDIYKAPLCEGLYEWGVRLAAYFTTNKLGVMPPGRDRPTPAQLVGYPAVRMVHARPHRGSYLRRLYHLQSRLLLSSELHGNLYACLSIVHQEALKKSRKRLAS